MAKEVKITDGSVADIIKRIEALDESYKLYENKAGSQSTSAEDLQNIYDGEHAILLRPDKDIEADGKRKSVHTAKVALNYQEDIVECAIAFLLGKPVTIVKDSDGGEDAFECLSEALNDMHFHSRCKALARKLFVQKRAAKLYFIKNPDGPKELQSVSSLVLSYENSEFKSVFDGANCMTAFMRKFKQKRLIDGNPKEVEMCEIYTAERIIYAENIGEWKKTLNLENPYKKIPVVYYSQDKAEWETVRTVIDETEMSFSKFIDTVDYFSKPKLKVAGKLANMPTKGEVGEVLEMEYIPTPDGSSMVKSEADYLTWPTQSESQKLMFDLAEKFIYQFSSSAAIDFLNMIKSNIGELSGTALEVLLLKPLMKAYKKQELWNEMLKREINVVMAMLGTMNAKYANDFKNMKISINFNSILPKNISDIIDDLVQAKQGGIISTETAVEYNPMVKNAPQEKERIKKENSANALNSIAESEV